MKVFPHKSFLKKKLSTWLFLPYVPNFVLNSLEFRVDFISTKELVFIPYNTKFTKLSNDIDNKHNKINAWSSLLSLILIFLRYIMILLNSSRWTSIEAPYFISRGYECCFNYKRLVSNTFRYKLSNFF